ncbi:magnesium ion transporter [Xylographa pallens]|nr:magnesium ion transporter [Xylographa pallens]
MFTPVRVRGKNNRDQSRKKQTDEKGLSSALPAPKRRPGRPHNSRRVTAQSVITEDNGVSEAVATYSSCLSTLEQLPTELLQTIFLLSRNINLPMSSLYLGSVLASPHLRTELVIHAFADREYSELRLYAGLQSSLLRQKWLTYDFFQLCQKTYLLQQAILVVQEYSRGAPQDISHGNVTKITEAFDTYYSLSHRILMKLDPPRYSCSLHPGAEGINLSRDVVFMGFDQKGVTYSIVLDAEGSRMYVYKPWVAQPPENLWPKFFPNEMDKSYSQTTNSMGSWVSRCEIPEKLLHGPWTNERGYFLKSLLDANAEVNWLSSTSGEVALQGFEDAIREDNSNAIRVLREAGARGGYFYPDTRRNTIRECLEDLATGSVTLEALKNPHASWRLPAGKAETDSYTAGVVPSTKHLKIAIFEKGANFRILKALLEGDGRTDIDCDDTELVDWALRKKAEAHALPADDVGSDIGDWLLDTLQVVREKQKKLVDK